MNSENPFPLNCREIFNTLRGNLDDVRFYKAGFGGKMFLLNSREFLRQIEKILLMLLVVFFDVALAR